MKTKKEWFDSAILKEDESGTTANARHFMMNNGTRKAVFFPHNINSYNEAEKKWEPIDNAPKPTETGYAAKMGAYTATFTQKNGNESVEVSDGTDAISWEYLGANKNMFSAFANPEGGKTTKRKSKLHVEKTVDPRGLSGSGRAVYTGAEGDIDMEYSIEGDNVKENIVVREKSDTYRYHFLLRTAGFEMKTDSESGTVGFYKTASAAEDAERDPAFVMPAPFMYDADGAVSELVKYAFEKLEDGVYAFSIEADAEWINAGERVFPVYIDPQLQQLTQVRSTTHEHRRYEWCDCESCCDGTCCEPGWNWVDSPVYQTIQIRRDSREKTDAILRVWKGDVDMSRNRLISAKLFFETIGGPGYLQNVTVQAGDKTYSNRDMDDLTVDVTSRYRQSGSHFEVRLSMLTEGGARHFWPPVLEVEYQPICDEPERKSFALEEGVSAEFDVLSGDVTVVLDDIADPALGVTVSHAYKPNDRFREYGQNFRLNLDETLVKNSVLPTGAQYVYTDACGDVHTFQEHFYRIGTDGGKEYLTSDLNGIRADADGRLWLDGKEVFRELTTDRGLRASARLNGVVNDAEWVEQRLDEEKQLEEQVKSYQNTLCNFVSFNPASQTSIPMSKARLTYPDLVESFLQECRRNTNYLLSFEEERSYCTLLMQKKSLFLSMATLRLQKRSIKNTVKNLTIQYNARNAFTAQKHSLTVQEKELDNEKAHLEALKENDSENKTYYEKQIQLIGAADQNETKKGVLEENRELVNQQEADWNNQKNLINEQIKDFSEDGNVLVDNAGILMGQYDNIEKQIAGVQEQISEVNAQINLLKGKSDKYVTQFTAYYREYLSLKNRLDVLKLQVPVSYLISDSTVKGFNEKGELVILQDRYGRYVVVEREKYTADGETRIAALYNQDNKTMRFSYNGADRLSEICNSAGQKVTFRYNADGALIRMERDHQPALTIAYTTVSGIPRISGINPGGNNSAMLSYNLQAMLKGAARKTNVKTISDSGVTTGATGKLSGVAIAYDELYTTLTYDTNRQEIYRIDRDNHRITGHYELINNVVTGAEHYTYQNHLRTMTERAAQSCLGRYPLPTFLSQMRTETVESVTYDSFRNPVRTEILKYADPHNEGDCAGEQTVGEYTYNNDRKLITRRTTHSYLDCCQPYDSTVAVERWFYDAAGELVRKESYIEGEEQKTGIQIEEYVYDDHGAEIQSVRCNSLDPSSKYYTENEVDRDGRITATFDGRGTCKTAFDYERDGSGVKTEHLPNGSRRSYGRDADGSVVAVTHSTGDGEENSTTRTYTLGVVTEMNSGNSRVRYSYDSQRRIKTVSLSGGADTGVTYTYSGAHTDKDTVTATMADGTTATTVRNVYGNVTKTTCGDRTVENTYDTDQRLTKVTDSVSGTTAFEYDGKGNLTKVAAPELTEIVAYSTPDNKPQSKTLTGTGISQRYTYSYKPTAAAPLSELSVDGITVRPATDALGRNTGKTVKVSSTATEEKISYVKCGDHATSLPAVVRFATNGTFRESLQYRYDSMGNIVELLENGRTAARYEYDALGRLTREDNVAFAKTTTWTYDNNGNLLARYEYALTAKPTSELYLLDGTCKLYTYADNSDRLIAFNGEAFEYDSIGNPTTYRGKPAVWECGRALKSYDGTTFTYDARGRRTKKNDITFCYDSNGNLISQSNGLEFLYDHTGVFAVKYADSTYIYRKDAQGNIVALLDNTGATMVKYKYDAWGNCKVLNATGTEITDATHIGILNPFRYRSYYYDTETGFYFLKTRYYDPELDRFLTIDDLSYLDPESINGLNLYAYCFNNPENCIDPTGNAPWWSWLISGLQLVGGIALCFVPGAQAIGVSMIVGGSLGLIANAVSPAIAQAIGGASSMANGWGAISTGISLLSFGIPGIIAGIGLMLVGGVTMAFGANEIVAAASGTNYIQEWTGMSDSAYGWTYFGLNVASSVGTAAGRWGMRIASNHILNSIVQNPSKITNYNLSQIKVFGKYTSQYVSGVMQKGAHAGQGYTLTNIKHASFGYIQWHPGGGHHGPLAYWKITSSFNRAARFYYISGIPF